MGEKKGNQKRGKRIKGWKERPQTMFEAMEGRQRVAERMIAQSSEPAHISSQWCFWWQITLKLTILSQEARKLISWSGCSPLAFVWSISWETSQTNYQVISWDKKYVVLEGFFHSFKLRSAA